jgi:hypothetical protein
MTGETDLATTHPDLAAQLVDQSLADTLLAGSSRRVEWECERGHRWTTSVSHRAAGTGCERCLGKLAVAGETDLATTHPDLAAQLVDQSLASELVAGSNKKVEWCCKAGHQWNATVASRVSGNLCPYCSGYRAWAGETDLATTHPQLAAELVEPELGATLRAGSDKKVLWRCEAGHEWTASVTNRSKGKGCPDCALKSFSMTAPAIVYLVATPGRRVYKFGITNEPENRLGKHTLQGFTQVIEVYQLPSGAEARTVERRIHAWAKAQGFRPALTRSAMPYGGATETLLVDDVGDGFTLAPFLHG